MKEKIIKELIKLCKRAYNRDEVPVSAIIIYKNKIIAKAFNKRKNNKNIFGHAEIIAIKKANKYLKDWRLDECEMYVSLEPCNMCKEIIKNARIKNVYYFSKKTSAYKEYTNFIDNSKENEIFNELMVDFFEDVRNK